MLRGINRVFIVILIFYFGYIFIFIPLKQSTDDQMKYQDAISAAERKNADEPYKEALKELYDKATFGNEFKEVLSDLDSPQKILLIFIILPGIVYGFLVGGGFTVRWMIRGFRKKSI